MTVEMSRTADTFKGCQPFCSSHRLFCSATLQRQDVLTEPLKSWRGNQPVTQLLITAHTLQNLIEWQYLNLYLWQKLNNAKIQTASWSRLKGHSILACKVQQKTCPEPWPEYKQIRRGQSSDR